MRNPARHRGLRTVAAALLLGALLSLAGCQAPGFVVANILPLDKIPAVYKLADQPTVVVVDDPNRLMPSSQEISLVSGRIQQDLAEKKVVARFIPPTAVEELRLSNADFNTWPIDRIGQKLGAAQVVYVLIDGFTLSTDPNVFRPTVSAHVKVIDVSTGRRMYPPQDPSGHGVLSRMYYKNADAATRGDAQILARKLADRLGEDVALLFYEHNPREIGSGFKE
jgi:hypothetical protein